MTTATADRRIRLAYATGALDITGLAARLTVLATGDTETATDGLPALPAPRTPHSFPRHPYPATPAVLAELAGITDPQARLGRAAQFAAAAAAEQEPARLQRLLAAITAHVRYDASQVSCYAPLGMTRHHFAGKVKQAPAVLPYYGSPQLNARAAELAVAVTSAPAEADRATARAELAAVNAQLADEALGAARRWHEIYAAHRSDADIARLVRDREIRALTSGAYGQKIRAVRICEDIGADPAWVSQIANSQPAA